jgi:hypothetical protein
MRKKAILGLAALVLATLPACNVAGEKIKGFLPNEARVENVQKDTINPKIMERVEGITYLNERLEDEEVVHAIGTIDSSHSGYLISNEVINQTEQLAEEGKEYLNAILEVNDVFNQLQHAARESTGLEVEIIRRQPHPALKSKCERVTELVLHDRRDAQELRAHQENCLTNECNTEYGLNSYPDANSEIYDGASLRIVMDKEGSFMSIGVIPNKIRVEHEAKHKIPSIYTQFGSYLAVSSKEEETKFVFQVNEGMRTSYSQPTFFVGDEITTPEMAKFKEKLREKLDELEQKYLVMPRYQEHVARDAWESLNEGE